MNTFVFLVLVFSFFPLAIGALVASYSFTQYRFNKFLRKKLKGMGFTVSQIEKTKERFTPKAKYLKSGVSFGGLMFDYAGSGSGMHFREVTANDLAGKRLRCLWQLRYGILIW